MSLLVDLATMLVMMALSPDVAPQFEYAVISTEPVAYGDKGFVRNPVTEGTTLIEDGHSIFFEVAMDQGNPEWVEIKRVNSPNGFFVEVNYEPKEWTLPGVHVVKVALWNNYGIAKFEVHIEVTE